MLFLFWACHQQSSPTPPPKPQNTTSQTTSVQTSDPLPQKTSVSIYFLDRNQTLLPVKREVQSQHTAQQALLELYKGPTTKERESGLTLITCKSTGAELRSVENSLAIVQLKGDCGDCAGIGIYESLVKTLKQFPHIQHVHVLDPSGSTQALSNQSDARPSCLEP